METLHLHSALSKATTRTYLFPGAGRTAYAHPRPAKASRVRLLSTSSLDFRFFRSARSVAGHSLAASRWVLTLLFSRLQCAPTCTCTRYDRHDFIETPIWRRRSRKRLAPIRSPDRASAPGFLIMGRQRRCKHGVRRPDMDRFLTSVRLEQQLKPIAPCEADTRAHRAEEAF